MSKEVAVVRASLDHVSDKFLLLVEKKRALSDMLTEVNKLEKEIRAEVGEAEEATIWGETVITNHPVKKFKAKEFEKDNPRLYKEFVRPVLRDEFDVQAFQLKHPNLYGQYQSRQFLVKER